MRKRQHDVRSGCQDLISGRVENLTQPGVDPKQAAQRDEFRVRASLPVNDVQWVGIDLVTTPTSRVNAESRWYSLR